MSDREVGKAGKGMREYIGLRKKAISRMAMSHHL